MSMLYPKKCYDYAGLLDFKEVAWIYEKRRKERIAKIKF